ncbi:MAG: DNA polymerase III subunit delta [Deltaproteobacteria bacterium]|nr:DNA polymerase III subunit delta [Deltaproteobacteria bacterium]
MSEIHYKDFKNYLLKLKKEDPAKVYLIFGEDFLVKKVLSDILDILIPESDREFNYEKIDGENNGVAKAVESMSTYSFLSDTKIVTVAIDGLFSTGTQAKDADASEENDTDSIKADAALLQGAIEKGFPDQNLLVMTTGKVDKRRTLYKAVKSAGMIIDCSIPQGSRMADKKAQEAVLYESMKMIVSENGKTMDRKAFATLMETTGFDLSTFANSLEKLVSYVGDSEMITSKDVASLVKRTKKDPIFELTGAISNKKAEQALFLIGSLLEDGLYPLQILAGIVNHIRKLLLIRDFMENTYGEAGQTGISYDFFKTNIMPAIISSDSTLKQNIEEQAEMTAGEDDATETSVKKGVKTDLVIAKNPNNPYPVFQTFLSAGNFSRQELIDAMKNLGDADLLLKTTGHDAKVVLERLVFKICAMQ